MIYNFCGYASLAAAENGYESCRHTNTKKERIDSFNRFAAENLAAWSISALPLSPHSRGVKFVDKHSFPIMWWILYIIIDMQIERSLTWRNYFKLIPLPSWVALTFLNFVNLLTFQSIISSSCINLSRIALVIVLLRMTILCKGFSLILHNPAVWSKALIAKQIAILQICLKEQN
jgi:hypothetical protein